MAPETGAICRKYYLNPEVVWGETEVSETACFSGPYKPNQGRSPLRTEMRALAASRRSIEAIRRLKIPVDGGKLVEAVLDILVPFYWWQRRAAW